MNKITEQDLANRGVKGLPDVPGLTTEEMQRKLEEIAREILIPKVNELVDGLNNANSNLTPNAFKNRKLIVQTGVNLLDGSLTKNETRMVSLTSAINSPIVSNGMALHKMELTDSTYFTNIVTLFILDSSETWHNYYHSATSQWTGWVKS